MQPQEPLSAVYSRAAGAWLLLCAVLIGACGAAADAYAGVSLRITLVATGMSDSEASFVAPKVVPSAAEQAAARAAAQAEAVAQRQQRDQKRAVLRAQVKALVAVYAAKSDSELTNLSAQLRELPPLDQQVLLREVKMRMARQRGRKGSVQIRTERRFGRLLRQPDGSVVRVETRVVRVRPATKGEQKTRYGTGFERRTAPSNPAVVPVEAQLEAQPVIKSASKAASTSPVSVKP